MSAFVAVGALLGIESIRGNGEHIVALDANAVEHGADDGAGLGRFSNGGRIGGGGCFVTAFSGHGRILARQGAASKACLQHLCEAAVHPSMC
jgi:hypothetical protein